MGTAAENDRADGASRFGVRDGNVAAAGLVVDGHFGNQRDAHSGAYHTQQTGKLAAFEDDLRVDASAIAGGDRVFAEAMPIAKQKEGFLADVFQGDGATLGKLVFWGKDGEQRFGEEREGFEFVAANGEGENGDVDSAGAEAVEKNGSDFFDYGELNLREFLRKGGEDARKQVGRDGGDGAYRNGAADRVLLFDDVAASGFEFVQDATGAREKGFSDFGEADGAAKAVEEAGAEFIFQFEDLLRERRLRDVGLLGGSGERAGVSDSAKIAKLMKFDKAVLPYLSIGCAYPSYLN